MARTFKEPALYMWFYNAPSGCTPLQRPGLVRVAAIAEESSHKEWHLQACFVLRAVAAEQKKGGDQLKIVGTAGAEEPANSKSICGWLEIEVERWIDRQTRQDQTRPDR